MKRIITSLLAITGVFFLFSGQVNAESTIAEKCGLENLPEENPDLQVTNCLLTEAALKYDIPPEIVKAVAEEESGDWQHFNDEGEPIVTDDGGIGLMQVTNKPLLDEKRLKYDLPYNIEAGVQILNEMFNRTDLPTINGGERDVIEHWYFAVMAYNGIKPVNSPIDRDGNYNADAYQERVFSNMNTFGSVSPVPLPFEKDDFDYDRNSSDNITFNTMKYEFNLPLNKSRHLLEDGYQAEAVTGTKVRELPTSDSQEITKIAQGEKVEITGPFVYEYNGDRKNHFVWYPVETSEGKTGFMTSRYIKFSFSDVSDGYYASEEINYLYNRNIINGIPGGKFGIGDPLTRWQAVLLITRANYTELGDSPDPGFSDVPQDYTYYEEIAAAVDEGLFEGTGDGKFKPGATLTRAEMAVVLQRLYEFPATDAGNPFTDVPDSWYTEEVNRLYHAGITNGYGSPSTFAPSEIVTRDQFAVFMTRSIADEYRIQ
ncbi:S-layer homology domain-containing protein [Halobacillus litoralis]|uniref:S-layer homology domain-containing protein n=1 Tax=Halobacillus litoralis TaxID=45668 RepID=UPI0024919807|nr:S-layer homology domain-containing protein [Halobacillus litoralis]